MCGDKNGRRVVLFLLAGRSTRYFTKDFLDLWAKSDAIRKETSKKEPDTRSRELLTIVSPAALEFATENAPDMLSHGSLAQILTETLVHATGDRSAAVQAVAAAVHHAVLPDESVAPGVAVDLANSSVTARTIKNLVKLDHGVSSSGVAAPFEGHTGTHDAVCSAGRSVHRVGFVGASSRGWRCTGGQVLDELRKEQRSLDLMELGKDGQERFAGIRVLAGK